ncbi:Peroxidase N [Arachis hypogaea]|nr:Peroxidase N [Arachis hypogaea]
MASKQDGSPNINSIRDFDVVNESDQKVVENAGPGVVSCAGILPLAAQIISSTQSDGPS